MKTILAQFRNEIAKLEVEQKNTKLQRKTVNFKGTRTMSPSEATEAARCNKTFLRAAYAAYGLLRGKSFAQIESMAKPINRKEYYEKYGYMPDEKYEGQHPLSMLAFEINEYLNKYGYGMPYEEKKNIWGNPVKTFKPEDCEKIVCFDKQTA